MIPRSGQIAGHADDRDAILDVRGQGLVRRRPHRGVGESGFRVRAPARTVRRDVLADPADAGQVQQGGHVERKIERLGDASRDADREDRVATDVEETFVERHRLQPQDPCHDRTQFRFDVAVAYRHRRQLLEVLVAPARRKRAPIDLAVRVGRQLRFELDQCRHHVVRQPGGDMATQRLQVRRGGPARRHDEDGELVTFFQQHDGALRDAGMRLRGRFDLAQFHARSADLHLRIGALDELEFAVGQQARAVAGPVDPRPRRSERIGDEALGRQPRATQIAARKRDAADEEFPDFAHCDLPQRLRIEHVSGRLGDRGADRDRSRRECSLGRRIAGFERGADRRLGGSVGIDEPAPLHPTLGERGWAFLAGHDERAQMRQVHAFQQGDRRRRQRGDGNPCLLHEVRELAASTQRPVRRQIQRRAGLQRHRDFPHRSIERPRRELQHAIARRHAERLRLRPREVRQARMRQGHALGRARGAGGVDDVSQLARRHRWRDEGGVAFVGGRHLLQDEHA